MLSPKLQVVVRRGREEVGRYPLAEGVYTLGRDPACDVPVEINRVSRRHARLSISESEWLLEDLKSSNGTLVDDQLLTEPVLLRPGQRIEMGDATIELLPLAPSEGLDSMSRFREHLAPYLPEEFLDAPRYEIGRLIKRGGMGGILDAREATIRRTVAMKVMLDDSARGPEVRRFIQEAQITGQLEHPNIVPVHELGVNDHGQIYYTMKFVDGVTLREILVGIEAGEAEMIERYPLAVLLTIFQKVCDAVAFAHSRGVVHRDLKPDNLMVGRYGEVLVMDWGLAKLVGHATGGETSSALVAAEQDDSVADGWRTLDGQILGTPCYMAPEQAEGRIDDIDAAADIYALGSILHHVLVLAPPVRRAPLAEMLAQIGAGNFPPPATWNARRDVQLPHLPGKRVPEALSAVAMKCLQKSPADRYPSVAALQRDIAAYQGGFATEAEGAGPARQFWLFVQRNRAVCGAVAAALVLLFAITGGFLINAEWEKAKLRVAERTAMEERNNALAATAAAHQERDRASQERDRALAAEQTAKLALQERDAEVIRRLTAESEKTKAVAKSMDDSQKVEKIEGAKKKLEVESVAKSRQLAADALGRGDLPVAQKQIEEALGLGADAAADHELHGRILQAQLDFAKAARAWRRVRQLDPQHPSAEAQGRLCESLDNEPANPRKLEELRVAMHAQGWTAEARQVLPRACAASMKKHALPGKITADDAGLVTLQTAALPTSAAWAALPIARLILDGSPVADLRPLIGAPLGTLSLRGCTKVADLTPLASVPGLRELDLTGCIAVADLAPLQKAKSLTVVTLPAHLGRGPVDAFLSSSSPPALERVGRPPIEVVTKEEFLKRWNSGAEARKKLAELIKKIPPQAPVPRHPRIPAPAKTNEELMQEFLEGLIARYGEEVDKKANLSAALAYVHGPTLPGIFPHPLVLRASFRRNPDPQSLFGFFSQSGTHEALAPLSADDLIYVVDYFGEVSELEQAREIARTLLSGGADPLSLLSRFPGPREKGGSSVLIEDVWPTAKGPYTPAALQDAIALPLRGAGAFAHRAYGACALLKSVGIPCKPVHIQPIGQDFCVGWIRVYWGAKWRDFGERNWRGEDVTEATPQANRLSPRFTREPGTWRWIGELAPQERGSTPDPNNVGNYPQLKIIREADDIFRLSDQAIVETPRNWKAGLGKMAVDAFLIKHSDAKLKTPKNLSFFTSFVGLNFVQEIYDYGGRSDAKDLRRFLDVNHDKRFLEVFDGKREVPPWRLPAP